MLTCPSCAHDNPDEQRFCGDCGTKLEAIPVREERKVITALFCDLVGSTALGERLDAEDISQLLRSYQRICRKTIESHGGVVEKFIGDAVVGVFGVPLAHEDDPERAVRAALRITDDIGASDLGIEVRIGVNTGEALVRLDVDPRAGEGFATGDTMNTAARLEAAAPVMGVAVGAGTYRASADAIVYEELPPVSAKGKAEPVQAWRARQPVARIGTPERDRTPFVGRDLELSMLTQLFDRSRSRPETGFVTIIAEPGLGKSRLVRELARHVDEIPELVTWREGRCLPYGDGISFWALGEIVKAQAGILETDDQPTVSAKLDQAITEPDPQTKAWIKDRLAPLVGFETTTEPPQRDEAFTAWRRFLEQVAASGPTVVVIEDLHWADDAFVTFLGHLTERTAGLPLLVVVSARPEVEERHPSWPPGRRSTVLSLSPLTDGDVQRLITQSLPDADPELIQIVLERAGGSPLYAEQLAAMLRERALPIAGGALDETMIPQSVQALIAARIDALSPEPKRVLMEASVVGKTFWSGALAAIADHDDLQATVGELVRREFCRPVHPSTMEGDHEFGFWHALVRDVAYAELTKAERARMHAATARWITDRTQGAMGEDAEIVVHHIDAALELAPSASELDTEGLTELLADALIAAGQATAGQDRARAIQLIERALSNIANDDARELRAKRSLAGVLSSDGQHAAARVLLEEFVQRSFERGDDLAAVRGTDDLRMIYEFVGAAAESRMMVEALRERLGTVPSPALAEFMAIEADELIFAGEYRAALVRAQASVDMATRLGIAPSLLAIGDRGQSRLFLGDKAGEADMRLAIDGMFRDGRTRESIIGLVLLGGRLSDWQPSASLEYGREALALAERSGMEADAWSVRAHLLGSLARLGRFDDVVSEAGSVLDRATEMGDVATRMSVLGCLARVDIHRGGTTVDLEEFAELLRGRGLTGSLSVAARLAHARGQDEIARDLLREAVEDPGANAAGSALAAIELGLPAIAETLMADDEPMTPFDRAVRATAEAGLSEAHDDIPDAIEHYRAASTMYDDLGLPVGRADALLGLGRCLLKSGDAEAGVASLRGSRELWIDMKATLRIREIDELLATVS